MVFPRQFAFAQCYRADAAHLQDRAPRRRPGPTIDAGEQEVPVPGRRRLRLPDASRSQPRGGLGVLNGQRGTSLRLLLERQPRRASSVL